MLQTANEVMVASNKIRPTTASLPTSSAPGLLPAQPAAVVTVVGVVVGTPESLEASGTAGALEAAEILGVSGVAGALEAMGVPEASGAAGVNLCPLLLAFSGFPDLGAAVVVAVAVVAVMVVVVVMVLVAVVVVVAMVLVFAMCSRI